MKINSGFLFNKAIKMIYRPALRNCQIDKTSSIGMASNCINLKMHRYSYMGSFNSVCDTTIGSFCSIASYCSIGGGKHPIDAVSTSPVFHSGRNILRKNFAYFPEEKNIGVIIDNDVWIGESVFIKDGVHIGTGAIVGAHSVVTKDVPPYAIVAGVPAKVLRMRFGNDIIQKLLDSKWWEWSDEKIQENVNFFASVDYIINGVQK